jgi:protein TonB
MAPDRIRETNLQGALATGMNRLPWIWPGAQRHSRALHASLVVSLALHASLLTVHFTFPDALRWKSPDMPLEVILVNANTKQAPAKTEALAQANLDRGGNTDRDVRASTPLPVTQPDEPGTSLAQAQRRVVELEERQRKLMAQAKPKPAPKVQPHKPPKPKPEEKPDTRRSGQELADLSLAALKLQAQLDRRIEAYQKRPRKKFIGARATEYRFAQYEEEWRMKVERVGTLNYPPEARGRIYGNLRLTVTIRPDGSVAAVELDRSSGLKVLDQAAYKIVHMAAPYAPFPPSIRKDTDLLVITRTWFFGRGDKIWTE